MHFLGRFRTGDLMTRMTNDLDLTAPLHWRGFPT